MKKLFAILLTAALLASFAVCALAADPINENGETSATGKTEDSYTIGVTGTYQAGSAAQTVISVDISWDKMEFTYNGGGATYDASTHTTKIENQGWTTDKSGITVTNHSNAAIEASFAFTAEQSVNVTGKFYTKGEGDVYTASADNKIELVSGEDKTTEGETYTEPKGTIYFGIDSTSEAITANATLGTITITISQATTANAGGIS